MPRLLVSGLFFFGSILLFLGCGYQLEATGQPRGISISSLAIPLMKSPSSALGFEADFTRMIREEFVSHSRVPLVGTEQAAMVLVGNVSEITTDPYAYKLQKKQVKGESVNYETTSSRWLRVRLEAKLIEKGTGKVVWEDKNMEERAIFSVNADPLETRYSQRKALETIAQRLAERVYLKTMEQF